MIRFRLLILIFGSLFVITESFLSSSAATHDQTDFAKQFADLFFTPMREHTMYRGGICMWLKVLLQAT